MQTKLLMAMLVFETVFAISINPTPPNTKKLQYKCIGQFSIRKEFLFILLKVYRSMFYLAVLLRPCYFVINNLASQALESQHTLKTLIQKRVMLFELDIYVFIRNIHMTILYFADSIMSCKFSISKYPTQKKPALKIHQPHLYHLRIQFSWIGNHI